MIRERARTSDSIPASAPEPLDVSQSDRGTVLQWVMDERRRELAFEEHRWYDLRRWHMGGVINLGTLNFGSVRSDFNFNPDVHIYFPLPASQVTNNPNLVQNSGY
ncbi:MAG: RagB/SusD family nutrient uptake outer membrane protein [Bacteroidia bacterium]